MKVTISCLLVSMLLGCAALLPGHERSNDTKGEELVLLVDEHSDAGNAKKMAPAAAAAGVLIPIAVEFAVDRFNAALEAEAARYSASYSVSTVREMYLAPPTASGFAPMKLKGFTLIRKTSKGPATELKFSVKPATKQDGFRVYLDSVKVHRAKGA